MHYRFLGATGLRVSEIGFGASVLGNPEEAALSRAESVALVHQALAGGCNFFDTAPSYAGGESERILGEALTGRRAEAILCTKFGHSPDYHTDFSASALRASVEGSLRRLKTDWIDVLVLHNPPLALLDGQQPQYEVLQALVGEGKLRAWGASLDWGHEIHEFVTKNQGQVIEILYNLFHQEPAGQFPAAASAGLGFLVKVPLDSGWLSGRYDRTSRFTGDRERWTVDQIERRADLVDQVRALCPATLSLTQLAIGFTLARPEVSTVLCGLKSRQQLAANLVAAETPLKAELVHQLQDWWEDALKANPVPW